MGPVQIMIIGFDRIDRFEGQIERELKRVTALKQMRILDLLFVAKDQAGRIVSRTHSDLTVAEGKKLGKIIAPLLGLDNQQNTGTGDFSLAEVGDIAGMIEPGTAGLVLLFEHVWAADLGAAIGQAGGRLLSQSMLTRELLMVVGEEMAMIAEAEETIEVAEAAQGMAMLEAMATIAMTEEVKARAIQDAAETVEAADLVKTAAVAEAVQALILAGFIREAAAQGAIDALVAAELLPAEVVDQAAAKADSR